MHGTVRAAGGLLWRERDGVVEVALVHRPRHQDWSLPKGKLGTGEHPLAAAYREVVEETGVQPAVGARLPTTNYPVLTPEGSADKTVDYWAMHATGAGEFTPGREVDELRWVAPEDAGATLSYRRDRDVVEAFDALPRPARTVVLVRHAAAVAEWDGPDVTRPLDPQGEADAERLAKLLVLFAPVRVVSATPRRCVQTVDPLTVRLGAEIESDGVFDEESHGRAPEATVDRLGQLAGDTAGPVVICSQGGVIADTVALLADTDGLELPSVHTPAGTAWVLTFGGDKLHAADQLAP